MIFFFQTSHKSYVPTILTYNLLGLRKYKQKQPNLKFKSY